MFWTCWFCIDDDQFCYCFLKKCVDKLKQTPGTDDDICFIKQIRLTIVVNLTVIKIVERQRARQSFSMIISSFKFIHCFHFGSDWYNKKRINHRQQMLDRIGIEFLRHCFCSSLKIKFIRQFFTDQLTVQRSTINCFFSIFVFPLV